MDLADLLIGNRGRNTGKGGQEGNQFVMDESRYDLYPSLFCCRCVDPNVHGSGMFVGIGLSKGVALQLVCS